MNQKSSDRKREKDKNREVTTAALLKVNFYWSANEMRSEGKERGKTGRE